MEKQCFIEIDGEQIPVTEDVYRAFKRPAWAERKRQERARKCRNVKGVRCTKDCKTCATPGKTGVISLEKHMADGKDIAGTEDVADIVAHKILLDQLCAAIAELEPGEQSLINALFYDERTERNYAAEIGKSHQAVGKQKKKAIGKLRQLMGVSQP